MSERDFAAEALKIATCDCFATLDRAVHGEHYSSCEFIVAKAALRRAYAKGLREAAAYLDEATYLDEEAETWGHWSVSNFDKRAQREATRQREAARRYATALRTRAAEVERGEATSR